MRSNKLGGSNNIEMQHRSISEDVAYAIITVNTIESVTQFVTFNKPVVSSIGGLTNGPSSGSTSATVAGFNFGSWGYSGKARDEGRGAASSIVMTALS